MCFMNQAWSSYESEYKVCELMIVINDQIWLISMENHL